MRKIVVVTFVVLTALMLVPDAQAQYFGRNKVQWERFDFKILHTDHFDIYYYDKEKDVVDDIGRQAERWYDRLSRVFQHEFNKKPIVLYANSADFHQTTTTGGLIGEGTGGFTDSMQNRIVMPLTGSYAENDHVLGHELVHVFQYDIANRMSERRTGRFSLEILPLWLIEGTAEYLSKGPEDALTAMWVRDASNNDRLPDLRELMRDPRYFPYRYGQALMAYIGGRFGDEAVVRLFLAAGSGGVENAFERALGIGHKELFADWHASARELYEPVLYARPQTLGTPLLGRKNTRGELNIAPSLSPDGRWVAFLTTRELFTIDLFLADAKTGKIARKLLSSDADPHFDSLRFIDSAGSWSPDSKKLALVIFERGDNRLAILNVDSGELEERIKIPGVDALTNPVWSPDGKSVAFSGQMTGVTDLFVYDLSTSQLRRLTNDKYADLQPAWSPDGRMLSFVTDRGAGTDFESLRYDDLRIATVDVATGTFRILPLFSGAKHINPQFSPDGRSIYFIANPEGVSDIYRYSFEGDGLTRLTHLPTGVSGITDLSPALSVAGRTGEIAFSVFEDNQYNVYTLGAETRGVAVSRTDEQVVARAALLPPLERTDRDNLISYLERPAEGLPAEGARFPVTPYDASLHLTYLGPPSLGVGGDRFGYGASGSIAAFFSDVLGRHNVGLTIQTGSSVGGLATSLGGELFYLNQERRINWGGSLAHIPYVSAQTIGYRDTVIIDGREVVADVIEQRRDIVTIDEVSALSQYPFGLTRRIEANVGYQRLAFKSELQRQIIVGGRVFDDETFDLEEPVSLNLFRGSTAFVGDSSLFGFISPVKGTRYRFEAEALGGDLNFITGLADWRKYFFMRPVTFAVRGLHYGRYGTDAEDERLRPLYVGSPSLVRGYEIGSFDLDECVRENEESDECPAFDRLIGSRIGLASAEFRVPLFGTKEYGLINAPALPTEVLAFVDAGVAWTDDESPKFEFVRDSVERVPVVSAGVSARILLAYIPIEIYYAKPFQRPKQDWVFGFNIRPGW